MWDEEISVLDHCTDRQLKELLALASTDAKTPRNWMVDIGDLEQLERVLGEMCDGAGALIQAVLSPHTSAEALVVIKGTAKRLAAVPESPAQKTAAALLYHLSVAAALAHHRQNISSKPPSERVPLYTDLASRLPDDRLAAIFARAIDTISAK